MPTAKILVVDDEEIILLSCERVLTEEGYEVQTRLRAKEGLALLAEEPIDLILVDLKMPGMDGLEFLRAVKQAYPSISVIMITGYSTVESAVEAMKAGAIDYLPKPFTPDQLTVVVKKALDNRSILLENLYLRNELQAKYRFENIIGSSKKMQEIFRLITKVAPTNSTVLITGESGTGKELIARAIHFASLRKDRPFIPVDCAVLSENLLESELFGHVKGSFTGAIVTKPGLFEVADGGSLFLDEIGNISPATQSKLLRVIQEREFTPVGGTKVKKVDIRLIAATNKDLPEKSKREPSGRISSTASTSSPSISLPCGSARKTSRCWPSISWKNTAVSLARKPRPSPPRHGIAHAPFLARQCPGAGEYHGAGRRHDR